MTTNHTGSNPSSPPNRAVPADVQETAPLPGVGVIRARALKKAGFATLEALRAATLEQLQAVPGITAVKAAHIHGLLHPSPEASPTRSVEDTLAAADSPTKAPRSEPKRVSEAQTGAVAAVPAAQQQVPVHEPKDHHQKAPPESKPKDVSSTLAIRARLTEIAVLAEDILRGPSGKKLGKPLQKQLERWVALSEDPKWVRGTGIERHLNAVETALRDVLEGDRLSGKTQDRLAALLRAERKAMTG